MFHFFPNRGFARRLAPLRRRGPLLLHPAPQQPPRPAATWRACALKFKASAPRLMNISVFVSLVCSLAACAPAMAATDNSPMLVETPVSPAIDPEWDLHFAVGLLSPLLRRHSASLFPSSSHLAGSVRTACPGQHRARPAGARAHRALFSRLFHASSRPLSRHMPCAASRSHSRILPSNTRARVAWPMTSSSAPGSARASSTRCTAPPFSEGRAWAARAPAASSPSALTVRVAACHLMFVNSPPLPAQT